MKSKPGQSWYKADRGINILPCLDRLFKVYLDRIEDRQTDHLLPGQQRGGCVNDIPGQSWKQSWRQADQDALILPSLIRLIIIYLDRVEDRQTEVLLASLPWRHSTNHVGAVFNGLEKISLEQTTWTLTRRAGGTTRRTSLPLWIFFQESG